MTIPAREISSEGNKIFLVLLVVCIIIDLSISDNIVAIFLFSGFLAIFGIGVKRYLKYNPYAFVSTVEIISFVTVLAVVILWYSVVLHSALEMGLMASYIVSFMGALISSNCGVAVISYLLHPN